MQPETTTTATNQHHAEAFDQSATNATASNFTLTTTKEKPYIDPHDILLNNFQIKKKRYRVLLNSEHLVWERLDVKQRQSEQNASNNEAKSKKEAEFAKEQLANRALYGGASHVVHINEIIRVDEGQTKSQAERAVNGITPSLPVTATPTDPETAPTLPPKAQYLSVHYAERVNKSSNDCNRWRVRTLTLHNTDPYIVRQWHRLLSQLLAHSTRWRVQRLLVFINPYGGRKQALQMYERHCKPLFQLAGIDASCIISQRSNQIRDILLSHDLSLYDAVCCVGGDGTVAEVINGLLFRTMRDLGIDCSSGAPEHIPKPRLPVGIIPAGSTDTIAYSMHGTADVSTAAIHVLLGQRRGMDVCSVRNRQGIIRFCSSLFSYGYLGDVAAKSEKYRWMGTKRYEFTGVQAFLANRSYEAEIRLLLDDDVTQSNDMLNNSSSSGSGSSSGGSCQVNCARCNVATPSDGNLKSLNASVQSVELEVTQQTQNADVVDNARGVNLFDCDSPTTPELPALTDSDIVTQPRWKLLKGEFFMISGANITCACERSPNGISRFNHLGDGYLELILVRGTSLFNNLRLLTNTMGQNGDIRNLPFVEVYRTKRFAFRTPHSLSQNDEYNIHSSCQPIVSASASDVGAQLNDRVSSWNCDGEVVTDLNIVMSCHCQLVDVLMRGPYSYTKPLKISNKSCDRCCCCCCCGGGDSIED